MKQKLNFATWLRHFSGQSNIAPPGGEIYFLFHRSKPTCSTCSITCKNKFFEYFYSSGELQKFWVDLKNDHWIISQKMQVNFCQINFLRTSLKPRMATRVRTYNPSAVRFAPTSSLDAGIKLFVGIPVGPRRAFGCFIWGIGQADG